MADAMTKAQKKAALDLAWANYRAASQAIPLSLPYSGWRRAGKSYEGFLEVDERLWRAFRRAEDEITAAPEKKVA